MRLTLFLIVLSNFSIFAQDFAPPLAVNPPDNTPNVQVEIIDLCGCGLETHYAGGRAALSAFVNDHIELPTDINWGNISRVRTYVEFIVEKDGSLSDIQVVRTNFPETNQIITSIFKRMTNWVAGEYYCETVRTNVRVPISLVIR